MFFFFFWPTCLYFCRFCADNSATREKKHDFSARNRFSFATYKLNTTLYPYRTSPTGPTKDFAMISIIFQKIVRLPSKIL